MVVAPEEWVPGLFHGERTLGDVLDTLPGITPDKVPAIIRFFENPKSNWALLGAISLRRHDCIHILLGRGLTSEDEAFVIGFTMGRSDGVENRMTKILRAYLRLRHPLSPVLRTPAKLRALQISVFKFVSRYLYPSALRLSASDLVAFDLGLGFGERGSGKRNLEDFPFESLRDWRISTLRSAVGIDIAEIEAINQVEKRLVPGAKSDRLDVDPSGVDHSRI